MAALFVHCCLYAYCGMVTFAAWRPFGPCTRSNSTWEPSASERKPLDWMAEKCTNTSSPPSMVMKPNPFASFNDLTLPVLRMSMNLLLLSMLSPKQRRLLDSNSDRLSRSGGCPPAPREKRAQDDQYHRDRRRDDPRRQHRRLRRPMECRVEIVVDGVERGDVIGDFARRHGILLRAQRPPHRAVRGVPLVVQGGGVGDDVVRGSGRATAYGHALGDVEWEIERQRHRADQRVG